MTRRGSIDAVISPRRFRAGVFDLDGVVTRTARLHFVTWKALFDDVLRARAGEAEDFRPFDHDDYRLHVDGRPRLDGIRTFLGARGLVLPEGAPGDPPERLTVQGLGARKNQLFNERLQREGVEVFDDSVRFIHRIRRLGMKTALVSSSRNTAAVLASVGLTDLFDVRVDGVVAAREGLRGKPEPDLFLCALELLRLRPSQAFGVEDALPGIRALRAADYRLVIGMNPDGGGAAQAQALRETGADIVVGSLAELQLQDRSPTRAQRPPPHRRVRRFLRALLRGTS
jgi:trehalose 6-phosphate phosphatase